MPWSNGLLWAPDVTKKGEWYYFYFCLSDGTEGVAKSKNPYGPFEDAVQITMEESQSKALIRLFGGQWKILLHLGSGPLPYGRIK